MSSTGQERRLTAAVIARDAETALDRTLESAGSIANECVVVDTGSQDGTRQVARRRDAVLLERPWDDDFAAARNFALQHASSDWVLWLDAGETVACETAAKLRSFVDRQADPAKAYMLLVYVPPAGKDAAGEQIGRVRLLPNHDALRYRGRVRENVTRSLVDNGIQVEGLPFRIDRPLTEHDARAKARKARRNIRLAELELEEDGAQTRLLSCLGEALQTLGDFGRSERLYRRALEASEEGSSEMLEAYYGLLTSLDGDPPRGDDQLSLCLQALEVFPLDAQLLCAMGGYLQATGRLDLTSRSYLTAYRYGKVNPEVWHLENLRELSAAGYSLTLQMRQQDEDARQFLEEAIAAEGGGDRLRRQLFELHVKHGRCDEALRQLDHLADPAEEGEALREAVRGAGLAVRGDWSDACARLEAAYEAGCRDPICCRWLAAALASTGRCDKARGVLSQWLELDPRNVEARSYRAALEIAPTGPAVQPRRLRVDEPPAGPPPTPFSEPSAGAAAPSVSPPPTS